MTNTDQCRDPKKLNVLAQVMLELALEDIKAQGVNPLVVETYRTQSRQDYLYAQGRTRPGAVVTKTRNSIHTHKNAVDIVPQRKVNGKMTAIWDASDKEFKIIIKTMEKYGWEAGANWTSFKDSPHYQINKVADNGTSFSSSNNNSYVTKVIQSKLNEKCKFTKDKKLVVDGSWGSKTTSAVNYWRKNIKKYSLVNGKLGRAALKALLK